MLENALESFKDTIAIFLAGEASITKGILVKKHSEDLQKHGEFSFSNTLKSSHEFIDRTGNPNEVDSSLLNCIGKVPSDFVQVSRDWKLQVYNVIETQGRIHLFLDRPRAIHIGLIEALRNIVLISDKICYESSLVSVDPICKETNCITSLRLKCLVKTAQNLSAINYELITPMKILVTTKSSSKSSDSECRTVLCGAVLNSKTGTKETTVSADEFIRIRQSEMALIAQHKYGVRVTTDSKWKEFIAHLGESAAIFELLQTKPSSAVKINFDNSAGGCSKGAAFILYNCARLETIIKTYNDKVSEGLYPQLPDFESTDFTLLTQDEEWSLIFNYVLGLPSLLNNCVEVNENVCEFRPHLICGFLCSMVRVVSQYYRKTRILTEPRKHLLPVIYARIHMLKILNDTLKICLQILSIKSVSQM